MAFIATKLQPLRETEVFYQKMFEACGKAGLTAQIKDIFGELQKVKNVEIDKATYSAYVESLVKA